LTCSINKGDLPINITWFHNNVTIKSDEAVSVIRVNKKISTLSIESVQAEHIGEYTCLAKNRAGATTYSTFLHVNGIYPRTDFNPVQFLVPPQILPFDFGEDSIHSGDVVSLTCSVNKGDLPLKISWEFNDKLVQNEFGVVVSRVNKRLSTLSIEFVQAHNAGEYKCVANNSAGFTTYSTQLNVKGTSIFLETCYVFLFFVLISLVLSSTSCHFTLRIW
jgi:hypothetical protein